MIPMEPKSLLVLLKENKDRVSTSEQQIITYILKKPEAIVGVTIHELAQMTFVSAATISRLLRKLSLGGYKEFQQYLIYELASMKTSRQSSIEDINPKDSTKQIMFKIMRKTIESITLTEKLNNPKTIDSCAELIHSAHHITIFGMGSSLLSAQDLQYKFLRANIDCTLSADWHMQLIAANNMSDGDVAIAFSYSGVTPETLRCVHAAQDHGGKVIAITRSVDSTELVRHADIVLYVASTEPLLRSSAGTSRITQLMIVDTLFSTLVNKHYDVYATSIEDNYISKK